jgi:hypothetical protein
MRRSIRVDDTAMKLTTRFLLLLSLVATLGGLLPLPATAAQAQPELMQDSTAVVAAGGSTWVTLTWLGTGDVASFALTAKPRKARGVEVSYPANTGDHSSLMRDDELLEGELDYTAVRLTVPYYQTKAFELDLTVRYSEDGKPRTKKYRVEVPVVVHTGADLEVLGDVPAVPSGGEHWVEVTMVGVAPTLTNLSATVGGDLDVTYPGHGTSTSLHSDDVLTAGETDVARFLVDTSGLAPGVHPFRWTVTYLKGSERKSLDFDLALTVTP